MNSDMALNLVPTPRRCLATPGRYHMAKAQVRANPATLGRACVAHKLATLGLSAVDDGSMPANALLIGSPAGTRLSPVRHAEGYTLRITTTGVALYGADANGLFWGLVTLEQLLNGGRTAPCAAIRDWPAFPFRYHHDDISRKQVSTVADFRRIR